MRTDDLAPLRGSYPQPHRGQVVVWGLLASHPFGGMAWQVLHYIAGLRRLGFDVWYVEDSDEHVYNPVSFCRSPEYSANVEYLQRFMNAVGMSDRWIFRVPDSGADLVIGAKDAAGLRKLYGEVDAVFNICGAQELRPEHDVIRRRIFVETDPVANQVGVADGDRGIQAVLDAHQFLFTYGENLGAADCRVPVSKYVWRPTRPPVCVDWWQHDIQAIQPRQRFTTVANWSHTGKDVEWQGEVWRWSKDHEFRRFLDAPRGAAAELEMAVGEIKESDVSALIENGWHVADTEPLTDPMRYYDYIRNSLGEFTVAKEQYVKPRSGWFSDRSVCYLASGRPVVTQHTGFEKFVPTGSGLFGFTVKEDILRAIEEITSDYSRHSEAARDIAEQYFGAERVIGSMMDVIGL